MKKIIVHNQKEFDVLPDKFDEFTHIYIQDTTERVYVNRATGNSSVTAWGNSSVMATGNSSVTATGNSSVTATGNSSVTATGNSSVTATGNSSVTATGNSSVTAWGNSSVMAWDNSSVTAWGNSSVTAWGNSSVTAWGNSSVTVRGNSNVEAYGNSFFRVFSDSAKIVLNGFSVAFVHLVMKVNIVRKSKNTLIQKEKKGSWFEKNGIEEKPKVVLFKKVSENFLTQEGNPAETKWLIGSVVKHPNWDPKRDECGHGKFHACSRPFFCDEFRDENNDKYIAIEIAKKDLYAWPDQEYPHKIAFRKGLVL